MITPDQVLKLESVGVAGKEANTPGAEGGKGGAAASGSNLSMNQTLEGHEGSVVSGTRWRRWGEIMESIDSSIIKPGGL